jgi:hypothetical protein
MRETEDQLELMLLGAYDPLTDGVAGLTRVLSAFDAATALRPDAVRVGRSDEVLSDKALAKAVAKGRVGQTTFLELRRRATPAIEYQLTFVPDDPVGFRMQARLPLAAFSPAAGGDALASAVVACVRELARIVAPIHGYAHSLADLLQGSDPAAAAAKPVEEIHWLNLYGRAMVDRIGRARLEGVPCETLAWLDDGSCLFTTRPGPSDFAGAAARAAQAAARAHLRPELDSAAHRAELDRRSAALAPVAPAFDPDVAELLQLMLATVDVGHRPAEIARLNAYKPPPVAERVAADALPPFDVDDVDAAIERYRDFHAERLVALLHGEIPAIMEGDPAVLPMVDFHFWLGDYPRVFRRNDIDHDLVPAVGAFLGEMLVRHLGGRWIPRRNLDEASVVIGDQAWLPFLRARHYLEAREAALDRSLTQFYRVAARSR